MTRLAPARRRAVAVWRPMPREPVVCWLGVMWEEEEEAGIMVRKWELELTACDESGFTGEVEESGDGWDGGHHG